jgi:hypothetical protein
MRFAFFAPLPRLAVCGHSSSADSESEHLIQLLRLSRPESPLASRRCRVVSRITHRVSAERPNPRPQLESATPESQNDRTITESKCFLLPCRSTPGDFYRRSQSVSIQLTRAVCLAASSSSGSTWTGTSEICGNSCRIEPSTRWAMRCPSRTESSPLTMMCRST